MRDLFDRYRGLLLAAAILVIVGMASMRGYLTFLNGPLYDALSGLDPGHRAGNSKVIMLELEGASMNAGDGYWREILQALDRLGARRIVLPELPRGLSAGGYEQLARSDVVIGRHTRAIGSSSDGLDDNWNGAEATRWSNWPEAASAAISRFSPVVNPTAQGGVYRYARLRVRLRGEERLTLEGEVAASLGRPLPNAEAFRPNFLGSGQRIPALPVQRLLAGDLTAQLVAGRVVLLAPPEPEPFVGLTVPGAIGERLVGINGFRAAALQSLLQGNTIVSYSFSAMLALVLAVAVGCLYFYQRAGLTLSLYFSVTVLLLTLAMTWAFLHYLYLWLPATEVLLTVFGMWVVVLNRQFLREQRDMLRVLNHVALLMKRRLVPESALESDAYWAQIGHMVHQILSLERSIFLETLAGDHRVHEIHAVGCSVNDVDERRRDYERAPYTLAIQARGVIPVSGYLVSGSEDEQQYLAPLLTEGRVLGFWAFSVAHGDREKRGTGSAVINAFAGQIAELLDQRLHIQVKRAADRPMLRDYLTLDGGRSLSRELRAALGLTTKRLQIVEEVFSSLHTAAVLYDPFGRLLLANDSVESLLNGVGIAPYDITLIDMIVALTALTPEKAREQLQEIVLRGQELRHRVRLDPSTGTAHMLNVRALRQSEEHSWDDEIQGDTPFSLSGILLELVETDSDVEGQRARLDLIKRLQTVTERFQARIKHEACVPELGSKNASLGAAFADYVARVQDYLARDADDWDAGGFPVRLAPALETASAEPAASSGYAGQQLTLTGCPDSLVLATPAALRRVLEGLLEFIREDTLRNGRIEIECQQLHEQLAITIRNQGIGLPAQQLQRLLDPQPSQDPATPHVLLAARTQLRSWSGDLEISSVIGEGTQASVTLRLFPELEL